MLRGQTWGPIFPGLGVTLAFSLSACCQMLPGVDCERQSTSVNANRPLQDSGIREVVLPNEVDGSIAAHLHADAGSRSFDATTSDGPRSDPSSSVGSSTEAHASDSTGTEQVNPSRSSEPSAPPDAGTQSPSAANPLEGWSCVSGVCSVVCGDGRLVSNERDLDGCDDGNTVAGDGCGSDCKVEGGYACKGEPSKCEAGCGDTIVGAAEECDDGNSTPGDGCHGCRLEEGATCDSGRTGRTCVADGSFWDVHAVDLCGKQAERLESCSGGCSGGVCGCVIRVRLNGDDRRAGDSWANAKRTVQAALEAAETARCEIWVRFGEYYASDTSNRSETFQLRPEVAVYGGFSGTESRRSERDSQVHLTTLHGGGDGSGEESGVYHVVTGADRAVLDGFTVTGGNTNFAGAEGHEACGAGVWNSSGHLTLRNVRVESNRSGRGAGVCNIAGTVVIEASQILKNSAVYPQQASAIGLGIFNRAGTVNLTGTVLAENSHGFSVSMEGGALHVEGGVVSMVNTTVHTHRGGGSTVSSAGKSWLYIRDTEFSGNTPFESREAGILDVKEGHAVIVGTKFAGNGSNKGASGTGGLQVRESATVQVIGSQFIRNMAYDRGGAISNQGRLAIVGSLFVGNRQQTNGGTVINSGSLEIRNSTFVGHHSGEGGTAILFEGSGTADISNSIFQASSAWVYLGVFADLHASTENNITLQENAFSNERSCPPHLNCPLVDPMFEWIGDLPFPTSERCIDAGDQTLLPVDTADLDGDGDASELLPLDLLGRVRVQGGALDLGAIEGVP